MNLLTVPEAAEATRMSVGWWRQRIFNRDVRFLKIGGKVLVPHSTIEEILSQSGVEPAPNGGLGLKGQRKKGSRHEQPDRDI